MAESAARVQWDYEGIDDWGCRTPGFVFAPTRGEAEKLARAQSPHLRNLVIGPCTIDGMNLDMAIRMQRVSPTVRKALEIIARENMARSETETGAALDKI